MHCSRYYLLTWITALLLAATAPTLIGAEVYRWIDSDGQVNFGEQPPTGVDSDTVKSPPPPPISADLAREQRKQFEQRQTDYTNDMLNAKEAQAITDADTANRAKNCADARRVIENTKKSMGKRVLDEAGNLVEQSTRHEKLKKAEESAQYWCS